MTPLEKLLNRSDKTEIKKLNKIVDEIDALEEKISSLNDEELKNMTNIFKEKLLKYLKNSKSSLYKDKK